MRAPDASLHLKSLGEITTKLQEKKQKIISLQKEANKLKSTHHLNGQVDKVSQLFEQLNTSVGKKLKSVPKSDGSIAGDKESAYQQQLQTTYKEMMKYIKSTQSEYQDKSKQFKTVVELESQIKVLEKELAELIEKRQVKNNQHNKEVEKYKEYMEQNKSVLEEQRKKDNFDRLMSTKKKQLDGLKGTSNMYEDQLKAASQLKATLSKMRKCTFDLQTIEQFHILSINPPLKPNQIPQILESIEEKIADYEKTNADHNKTKNDEFDSKVKSILEGHDSFDAYRSHKLKELEKTE